MNDKNIGKIFSDEDFVNLLSVNGEAFIKYLFDKYYAELCRLSFKYVGRTEISEDIVQDVFINLWNKRFVLNYSGKIKPCLITSVINTSLNYIQSKFARQNILDESHIEDDITGFNQHDEVVKEELDKIVKLAIEKLPDKCRTIFMLSRFSGLTYKEIADKLNISIKTVEAQISIALKKILHFLSKFGYFILFII
jgi:RNA polymerase sigma-70 factor (ECF subfamily)